MLLVQNKSIYFNFGSLKFERKLFKNKIAKYKPFYLV